MVCESLDCVSWNSTTLVFPSFHFIFFDKWIWFVRMAEAGIGGVLWKKMFLKISQNSQENTCVRVSFFNKVACPRLWHRSFPVNFMKFWGTSFYRTPPGDCFWNGSIFKSIVIFFLNDLTQSLLILPCYIIVEKRMNYYSDIDSKHRFIFKHWLEKTSYYP